MGFVFTQLDHMSKLKEQAEKRVSLIGVCRSEHKNRVHD